MKGIVLYEYQKLMLRQIISGFKKEAGRTENYRDGNRKRSRRTLGRAAMVQMPTGTGKTVLMAACIKKMRGVNFWTARQKAVDDSRRKQLESRLKHVDNKKNEKEIIRQQAEKRWKETDEACSGGPQSIWVVAHRRELVEQIRDTLTFMGISHIDGNGDLGEKDGLSVKVMSVQWLTRHHEEMPDRPVLLIVDEAHHSLAKSYIDLWEEYPYALKLGFTATPCRMTKQSFDKLYDCLYSGEPTGWFIRHGYLSEYDYVVANRNSSAQIKVCGLQKRAADGDFAVSEMEEKFNVEESITELYDTLMEYAPGKKGIVYAIDTRHAKNIARYYRSRGLRAVAVDNKTPSALRKRQIKAFKAGDLDCIVNVNLFDEGFDCPDVEYIQLARPTLSLSKYLQMVGRGLRVHPKKEICAIIDNVGLWRVFGAPDTERDWTGMFHGWVSGCGILPYHIGKGITHAVSNGMETVRRHSDKEAVSNDIPEKTQLIKEVRPYEQNGKWGLRNERRVFVAPLYRKIFPSDNGYFIYEGNTGQMGVLRYDGYKCIPAGYLTVKAVFLPHSPTDKGGIKVQLTRPNGSKDVYRLKSLFPE